VQTSISASTSARLNAFKLRRTVSTLRSDVQPSSSEFQRRARYCSGRHRASRAAGPARSLPPVKSSCARLGCALALSPRGFMAARRLTGPQTVDGSARQRAPANTRVLLARVTNGVARLSIHCPKYGPESDALANGSHEETRSMSGLSTKRLMGLEPTTFCMASST
jgi:hypothetical protein